MSIDLQLLCAQAKVKEQHCVCSGHLFPHLLRIPSRMLSALLSVTHTTGKRVSDETSSAHSCPHKREVMLLNRGVKSFKKLRSLLRIGEERQICIGAHEGDESIAG